MDTVCNIFEQCKRTDGKHNKHWYVLFHRCFSIAEDRGSSHKQHKKPLSAVPQLTV